MSLWRQIARGSRVLARRRSADQDIADEVRHYVDQATSALVARGLDPREARRAAELEIGNATVAREQVRAYGWENAVANLLGDLRFAARRLRSNPGFTVVSTLTLALGIGASTSIFSAVNPILFEPLPYRRSRQIVTLSDVGSEGAPLAMTFGTYREIVARTRSFDATAVSRAWQPTMTALSEPERFTGQRVSAGYFRTLGVTPALGRDFDVAEDRPGGGFVALISDGVWRHRFGGDATVVGRHITLDGEQYTVIGVMPPRFEDVPGTSAELWTTLRYASVLPSEGPEWGHNLRMIARLRGGVSLDQARRELATIARQPVPEFARPPWAAMRRPLIARSLQDDVTRGVKPALIAVLGAALLVLVIACVNVTNLLLARGAQRRGEFAMRAALGAGRSRLIRQMLTESLLLAAIGGALGIAVAEIGVRGLVSVAPPELPRASAIGVNATALLFALTISVTIGLVVGLAPAVHASRNDLHVSLQQDSRRTASGRQFARGSLVVAEVALAMMLLVGAGLLLRSLSRLFAVNPGFAPAQLLTMQVQVSGEKFNDDDETFRFFAQSLETVRRVPGVTAAALTSQLPLSGDGDQYGTHFESSSTGRNEGAVFRYAVSPGYFETMGIPILRGRALDAADKAGAPPVVLINESFAKRKFPDGNAVGQHLRVGPDRGPWFTIVGVVADVKQVSLAMGQADAVYMPTDQSWFADNVLSFVVRTRGDAAALAPAVKRAIWSVDKDQPIVRVATMDHVLAASAAQRRFALSVFEAFALVAMALAAIGIYGVLSGGVTERTREIGVRSALGATPGGIVGFVVRRGMTLTGIGVLIGLAGAIAASQTLVTLLFGVTRLDPATYLGVIVLLLVAAAVACVIPARRAARVDPAITLRAE
jgi:putative ABC transport system permease protein